MIYSIVPANVAGLPEREQYLLGKLIDVYNSHDTKNQQKEKYYEGHISLSDVNLGIALPEGMAGLEIGCAWGAKTVDVLAARSMFDGYVSESGESAEELDEIVKGNDLIYEYTKACRDELEYGCTFATLSKSDEIGCKIRFHSPRSAAALWDGEKGRIQCGFAIIDTQPSNDNTIWEPSLVNLYTDDAIWALERKGSAWTATAFPHRMGRPLM